MSRFRFVQELPPASGGGTSSMFKDYADALRAKPGCWAQWPTRLAKNSAYTTPAAVRRGKYRHLPAAQFEAVIRNGVVYARYIGKEAR